MPEGNEARVIAMQVLPFQSADLCFEVSGIMGTVGNLRSLARPPREGVRLRRFLYETEDGPDRGRQSFPAMV